MANHKTGVSGEAVDISSYSSSSYYNIFVALFPRYGRLQLQYCACMREYSEFGHPYRKGI